MKKQNSILIVNSLLLLALLLPVNSISATPTDLFIPIQESTKLSLLSRKNTLNKISMKEKHVGINTSALTEIPDSLNIDLFGNMVTAVLEHSEKVSNNSISWVGYITASDNNNGELNKIGEVILVISDSLVQGNITYQKQQYHIRYAGSLNNGALLHQLRLVDPSKLKDEHPPEFLNYLKKKQLAQKQITSPSDTSLSNESMNKAGAATDSGEFIDVMVLWTPAARQGAGGTAAIKALIDLAFVETNQSYANSDITPRLRQAHKQEVSYTEADSIFTDIDRLSTKNDGYLDNIHTLRNTHKADLVSLFINTPGIYCGLAGVPLTTFQEIIAFSVINYSCAVNNRSFAHELGHNFSALHDWRTDSDTSLPYIYPYSHGFIHDGSDSWRTIMSYRKCTGSGSCTRLNYWSNPDKRYNGVAMGVAEGLAQPADNRKTLNNAAFFVANYRVSETGTTFSTLDIDENGQASPLTDGLLTLRYLFGFTDDALTANAVDDGATRNNAADIQAYLQAGVSDGSLDIDNNGEVKPLTDGLLVLRFLFGFSGDSLISNAVGQNAMRTNATAIEAYLKSKLP